MKTTTVTSVTCTMCGTSFTDAQRGRRCPRCKEFLPTGGLDANDLAVLNGPSTSRRVVRIVGLTLLLILVVVAGYRTHRHFVEKSNDEITGSPRFLANFKQTLTTELNNKWRVKWAEQESSKSLYIGMQLNQDDQIGCTCTFDFEADQTNIHLTSGGIVPGQAKGMIESNFNGERLVDTKAYNDPSNRSIYEKMAREVVLAVRQTSRKSGLR